MLAGLALGIAASMKATAWPALLVAIALLAVRDGKRAVRTFTLTALGVVAVCVGPFVVPPQGAGGEHHHVPARAGQRHLAGVQPAARPRSSRRPARLGHTIVVVLLVLAGVAVAVSLVVRPPRSVPRAVLLLAGAMTLMFVLAPSTRFGYFIYPATLAIWLLAVVAGRAARDEAGHARSRCSSCQLAYQPAHQSRDAASGMMYRDRLRVVLALLGQAEVAQRLHVARPVGELDQDRVVGRVPQRRQVRLLGRLAAPPPPVRASSPSATMLRDPVAELPRARRAIVHGVSSTTSCSTAAHSTSGSVTRAPRTSTSSASSRCSRYGAPVGRR